jgi:hypothetical protein
MVLGLNSLQAPNSTSRINLFGLCPQGSYRLRVRERKRASVGLRVFLVASVRIFYGG